MLALLNQCTIGLPAFSEKDIPSGEPPLRLAEGVTYMPMLGFFCVPADKVDRAKAESIGFSVIRNVPVPGFALVPEWRTSDTTLKLTGFSDRALAIKALRPVMGGTFAELVSKIKQLPITLSYDTPGEAGRTKAALEEGTWSVSMSEEQSIS